MARIQLFNPNSAVHATSASGVERRNDGTVMFAGNVDTTAGPITNNPTPKRMPLYGAKVSDTTVTPSRLAKPYTAGTYAYRQVAGEYIVRGMQSKLSGQSNTVLNRGSDFARKLIHTASGDRRLAISAWSYTTGDATTGVNTGLRMEFGSDHESYPRLSRALPGEFGFQTGDNIASTLDYPAKT